MKVVLATAGRFHMFALAREMERLNALQRIYTGFPWEAVARENLPRKKVSTFPIVRPLMMLGSRLGLNLPDSLMQKVHYYSLVTTDAFANATLPDCDIYVGHEAVGYLSGAKAKSRGAKYVYDRGCSHTSWRKTLLDEEYERLKMKPPVRSGSYELELREYENADLIVTPSSFAHNTFLQAGVPAGKLAMVPYGVDTEIFNVPTFQSRSTFEVIFIGGLSVRKGAHDLIEAFEKLPRKDKRLTIVGAISGEIMQHLGARLRADNIRLLGHVPHIELKNVISNSDVLVLPSIEDGFGMVIVEALACGCPVIATEHTGGPDVITDGVEGFIVPIRSPETIAERLEMLAANPDARRSMSISALERVKSIGGWKEYGESMFRVYQQLLTSNAGEFN